jgi:hypothetical protein
VLHLRGLAIVDLTDPSQHGRILTSSPDRRSVRVRWDNGNTESINAVNPRYGVVVPLPDAARNS